MPSTPDENSPYADSQVNRMLKARIPGGPSTAGKAGAVHPGRVSYPAPPGLQAGTPGRPPSSTGPAPGAGTPPPTPTVPASPQPTPGAGPSTTQPPVDMGQGRQASVQSKMQQAQPQAGQGVQTGPPVAMAPTVPKPGDLAPGAQVETPLGTASKDPKTGADSMALSPEGQEQYRQAKSRLRKKLGNLPPAFQAPGMPQLDVRLGQWNYNPFSGVMTKGED